MNTWQQAASRCKGALAARLCRWQLLVCLLFASAALANGSITVAEGEIAYLPAGQWLDYYDPGIQELQIDDISSLQDKQWKTIGTRSPAMLMGIRKTIWYRLHLRNRDDTNQSLVIRIINPMTDSAVLYAHNDSLLGQEPVQLTGYPVAKTYPLTLPALTGITVYARIDGFLSPKTPLLVQTADGYDQQYFQQQIMAGLIDGSILGLVFYHILLGIKTRQPMYYAFCLLGASNLAAIIIHQDFFSCQLTWFNPVWLTNLKIILPLFAFAAIGLFIRVFLEPRQQHPRADNILKTCIYLTMAIAVAFLVHVPTMITTPLFLLLSIAAIATMVYLCLSNTQHQRSSMLLTVSGLLVPGLSIAFTAFSAIDATPGKGNYVIAMQFAAVIEILLLSLALANRVQQLQQTHLHHTQAASTERIINDAHNRLLAHLNHELRTPLNGILGAAEILLHKSSPRERHIFNMIYQTALPLKHLVDGMVNIQAITENRKSLQSSRFDLHTLLQECMDIFLPTAHSKHIRLFFRIDLDVATDVTGDPNRLRQILLNLLGNACKFTRDGEVGLQVSQKETLDNRCLYHFEVIDSGLGISQADEQRLFQTFATGNPLSNPQGAGLGLSIVRELSELLGGGCGYSNSERAGSKFWFTAVLEIHQHFPRKPHKVFEKMHVMIADESAIVAEEFARQINSTARLVTATSDRNDILAMLAYDKPDIALVHLSLLDDATRQAIAAAGSLLVPYQDQSESLVVDSRDNSDQLIIRRPSMEQFTLQVADILIRKNHLIARQTDINKSWSHLRILVAEDIATNQYIIREILQSLSVNPVVCDNGRQAFDMFLAQLLDGKPFDAILMDCEMPVMDGFEATRLIRQYEAENSLAPTTIIALTAHTEAAYRQRSEAAGMDRYVSKPVTVENMRQCLLSLEKPWS